MAKHTQVILIDDLDGGEADETVTFALDGSPYEIDLSDANAKKLREALASFVSSARKGDSGVTRGRRPRGGGVSRMSREKSAEIRAWAKANNHPVSERGRISAVVVEAYEQAH
jgi:hypothetical protein